MLPPIEAPADQQENVVNLNDEISLTITIGEQPELILAENHENVVTFTQNDQYFMLVDQTHLALATEEETEVTETENEENIFTLIQEYLNLKSIDETPCVTFYNQPEVSSKIDVSFGLPFNEQLFQQKKNKRSMFNTIYFDYLLADLGITKKLE